MATSTEGDRFDVLNKIGQGSFGVIRRVSRRSDGKVMCRKEINYVKMSTKEREQLNAEISILSSLRHPNIVAYYHREHLKTSQELHLYMEYCGGGDLAQYIANLRQNDQWAPEEFVWGIVAQLVTALYRCHYGSDPPEVGSNVLAPAANEDRGLRSKTQIMILHRDLKPENVFLGEDNSVKLGDFGLSKLMQSHDFASTYVGTPYYMSPEICAAERYTLQSDIWSLGCIIYELCMKKPPFDARTHFHLVQKIKDGRYESLNSIYSRELAALIASCLRTNPKQRPETQKLIQLPAVRLMRKEREVVELGKLLRAREKETAQKVAEAEALHASLDQDKERARMQDRAILEEGLRREWEVKARLEIDRQVSELVTGEKERLQAIFEAEVQRRVGVEVELTRRSATAPDLSAPRSPNEQTTAQSSINSALSVESPPTDLTSLSLGSPSIMPVTHAARQRTKRTPFARARTQIDSPMDVHMASPSPYSIASLSLSPRRAALLAGHSHASNMFAQAALGSRAPTGHTRALSQGHDDGFDGALGDDEDEMPDLPSPSRPPRGPLAGGTNPARPTSTSAALTRPAMRRLTTAPASRLSKPMPPPLFSRADTGAHDPKLDQPTSPLGRKAGVLQPTQTQTQAPIRSSGTCGLHKAVMQREMALEHTGTNHPPRLTTITGHGTTDGQSLLELQQQRSATSTVCAGEDKVQRRARRGLSTGETRGQENAVKSNGTGHGDDDSSSSSRPAVWNPDTDDMPSPFLIRGRRGLVVR